MQHPDQEELAALAAGEPVEARVGAHVPSCPSCTRALLQLRQVVGALRSDLSEVPVLAPPPSVWEQIAAATGVESGPAAPAAATRPAGVPPAVTHGHGTPPATAVRENRRSGPAAGRSARPARSRYLLAAAALVVGGLVGSGVTLAVQDAGRPVAGDRLTPVVALTAVPGQGPASARSGDAQVVREADGPHLLLQVHGMSEDPAGYREVWLADRSVGQMVPIGVLQGSSGDFALPRDLNLRSYPVVDVSAEPFDGDPAHSGTSLLRGTLS